jgi:flavin-dependent dehydrogenase
MTKKTIAIVGASLAGLSCAVRLKELGHYLANKIAK